jgi:putative flavoprotein involved in K+ transport
MSQNGVAVEPTSTPSGGSIVPRSAASLAEDTMPATHVRGLTAPVQDRAPAPPIGSQDRPTGPERVKVVVIGAGQAGLSVGYHLTRHNIPFVVLDANDRVGDTWRRRWDSLRLFTPARFDGLDGMPFPAAPTTFPTKDEMADYLEAYAVRFHLPVRPRSRVDSLTRLGDRYILTAGRATLEAEHVVVAMASYQQPKVPQFASELDAAIVQLHSSDYRRPSQLRDGPVLLVGAGNSGSEIAVELTRHDHRVWMSGRDTGHLPFRIAGPIGQSILQPLVLRVVFHRLLTTDTWLGRKVRPVITRQGGPLIRVLPRDLAIAGVERVGRVCGVERGQPVLEDGRRLDVANVVWCTGFEPGFSWIHLPVLNERGVPNDRRGVVSAEPGLYFVGLTFLYAMSSSMIHGVGRDARYIGDTIAARVRSAAAVAEGRDARVGR